MLVHEPRSHIAAEDSLEIPLWDTLEDILETDGMLESLGQCFSEDREPQFLVIP